MSFNTWVRKYKPIKNKYDENAPFNGCMFETFGRESRAVLVARKSNKHTVWTMVEDIDNNKIYIYPGLSIVNRLGYFITENQWQSDDMFKNDLRILT